MTNGAPGWTLDVFGMSDVGKERSRNEDHFLVATLNRALEGLQCTKAVHICYGYGIEENTRWKETLGDEWLQYDEIFPGINKSAVDQISLECASSHVPLSVMRSRSS